MEVLISFKKKFPKYNISDDLDLMYKVKEDKVYKDFVKYGVDYVEQNIVDTTENTIKEEINVEVRVKAVQPDEVSCHLDKEVVSTVKPEEETNLSQVDSNTTTPDPPPPKHTGKKERSKKVREKRRNRLLKFHQKLVDVSGLPPSRLMHQQTPTRLSSAIGCPSRKKRRNLYQEIHEQQNETKQKIPEPGIPAAVGDVQGVGEGQWHDDGTGMSIGNRKFSTLSSGLPSAGLSPGWSDARPFAQCGCGLTNYQPQGMFTGVSSGFTNPLSLCSGPQSCFSWSPPVNCPKTPPAIPSVSMPAYCYGCLQFGTVYNVC